MTKSKPHARVTWYHGLSKESLQDVKAEQKLFGYRGLGVSRCTYLTPNPIEALCYGDVLLRVRYNPLNRLGNRRRDHSGRLCNNYEPGCWQMRVYEPIAISSCRVVDVATLLHNPLSKRTK